MSTYGTLKPLQNRVEDYLRSNNSSYFVEEIEDTEANLLVEELREAEEELKQVQNRVARLKELIAKKPFEETS